MSFSLCPACCIAHKNPQMVSMMGETGNYIVCLDAAKEFAKDFESKDAQREFIKCTMEFIKEHSKESCEARKKKNRELPIIKKPVFLFNTAADQDSWRRNSH